MSHIDFEKREKQRQAACYNRDFEFEGKKYNIKMEINDNNFFKETLTCKDNDKTWFHFPSIVYMSLETELKNKLEMDSYLGNH